MTMTGKVFSAILGIPVVALGLVVSGGSAEAASLNAPGEISFTSSVILTGVAEPGDDGVPGTPDDKFGTNFDFVLPENGGTGDLEIAALSGSGGFASFNAEVPGSPDGFFVDNTIFALPSISTEPDLPFDLVRLFNTGNTSGPGDTFFMITGVDSAPDFDQIGNDLDVTIGVEGMWRSPDGNFNGSLVFTSQFVDTTEEELIALLATNNPILPANGISVTGEATEKPIPEPTSTMAALLAMGLGAVSLKKRRKQANLA